MSRMADDLSQGAKHEQAVRAFVPWIVRLALTSATLIGVAAWMSDGLEGVLVTAGVFAGLGAAILLLGLLARVTSW